MWILLATLLWTAAAAPAASARAPLDERIGALFDATADLLQDGRADSVLAEVDGLVSEATAARDPVALIALQTHRGRTLARTSRFARAEAALREALATAEAHGDSTRLLEPLYRIILAIDAQGRPSRVVPWMQRLLDRATGLGDAPYEARVRTLLARRAMREGRTDEAQAHLARAAEIFSADRELAADLPSVLLLQGLAHANGGDLDAARRSWRACADSSRALDLWFMEANALTNLGILEGMVGDPAAAARVLERAHEALREGGRLRAAVTPAITSARALSSLGRYDRAVARLDTALHDAREAGLVDLEASVRRTLADVHAERGARGAAVVEARAGLRAAEEHDSDEDRLRSAATLARHLAARDSIRAALTILDGAPSPDGGSIGAIQALGVRRLRCELQLRVGASENVLGDIRSSRAAVDSLGLQSERVPLAVLEVEALLTLGRRDEAATVVREAIGLWEQRRLVTTDPQWREVIGRWSPRLAEAALRSRIGVAGEAEESWTVLQRLRTRTLLERMAGPRADDSMLAGHGIERIPALDDLRARLGDRVWIEVFWGERAVWVWTLDATSVRVRRLDDPERLRARVERLGRLAQGTGHAVDPALVLDVGRTLGRELFGADVDGPAWMVADGPLLRLPPSLLRAGRTGLVPSAAVLVGRAEAGPSGVGASLLALAGERDGDGTLLEAVGDEIAFLTTRAGARRGGRTELEALDEVGVLHVAAHAAIDDQAPWRSGVLLREGRTEHWWRAESIATTAAPVDLVVLSACRGADGRVIDGEGMVGLTQAFLVAGARAVVATAWPVDDGVSAAFTRAFYAGLDQGLSVGAAVEDAVARLREHPATSHPRHWAPWTVYGDASVRPPVSLATPVPTRTLLGVLLLAAGLVFLLRIARR